jgi:AraC family transcriptional regulator
MVQPQTLVLRVAGGFIVTQQRYAARTSLADHRHRLARLTFVLSGTLRESRGMERSSFSAGSVVWSNPFHAHTIEVEQDTLVLLVEIESQLYASLTPALGLSAYAKGDASALEELLRRVMREVHSRSAVADLALQGLLMQLLADSARLLSDPMVVPLFVDRAVAFIEESLAEPISTPEVAEAAQVTVDRLRVGFRRFFGTSVTEYVRRRRIERAMDVLVDSDRSLSDLALDLGFCDQPHLARVFKELTGTSPGRYRRESRPSTQ